MGALMSAIREQALLFGRRKSLVGIIAQSSTNTAAGCAIVILNSGIIHRVGPNRIFVRLARRLAAGGHLVVRFDLSGIGDSEPREDGLAPLDAALADIREVLDSLESTRQVRRVILVGLCSGADQSVIYGGQDERVKAVVSIDPSLPRTTGYYVRHYRRRLFRLQSWLSFASARHPFWRELRRSITPAAAASLEDPELQPASSDMQSPQERNFLRDAYASAVAAGVRILVILTGGREDQHNHPRQLFEAFPSVRFGSLLRLEFFGKADHTFSGETDRSQVMQLMVEWISAQARLLPSGGCEQVDSVVTHASRPR
jgi:pimeloyl-ACP methyl ester carboxylesterase